MFAGLNKTRSLIVCGVASLVAPIVGAETITIGIGHQSTVTNTVPGGIILEKLKLLEKHLPKDGKYSDADYKIVYKDYTSGPPITNQMIAGKLSFGVMGDYPLIVNGAKFEELGKTESRFIAVTGYNLKGTGNGIVVPMNSDVYSLDQLKGKTISTPVGSAAWGMTLKVLRDHDMLDGVELKNQAPPVGVSNIAQGKIDAHSDFCPWSEVMEFRGTGRKIYDGSEADIPTFHGTVVRTAFAEKYPEIVQAYLNATLEAQDWINADPVMAATKVGEWTGIEKEVLYLYFSKGGISTFEASIKPEWVAALKYDHDLLMKEKDVPPLTFEKWIDSTYVKAAYEARGVSYDKQLTTMVTPVVDDKNLAPAEIWLDKSGIKSYDSVAEMTADYKKLSETGEKINAAYVYDKATGLKLFSHVAFYVEHPSGELVSYMKKGEAEKAKGKGALISWSEVVKTEKVAMAE
ncbi:sulfonate ABC transporter substrate-binding protein [Ketobacter sp. MCCC 1A13808]|uniref:ABC transporter substrate-binding protein n=1 Tax=Ketobacter sp. MCCC 1A13808 TaxID=2602738 RepID=UPI000F11DCB4|nr:ABC transporter substrate-binding protein [Ketobacter sp. MCCC 1A13808]MVF14372.1 sulfonate ABC transporter substrate-binding protein [Ketobacter sp. MCCC 1A13808]RLP55886.1 MAG: sulfonate ABC transporter substrate-binding protein [Ketobacter sp.]